MADGALLQHLDASLGKARSSNRGVIHASPSPLAPSPDYRCKFVGASNSLPSKPRFKDSPDGWNKRRAPCEENHIDVFGQNARRIKEKIDASCYRPRPFNFESVGVISVGTGKSLLEQRGDPRPYVGGLAPPALSSDCRKLAVIGKGFLEVYDVQQ
jgi:hypothetical protein